MPLRASLDGRDIHSYRCNEDTWKDLKKCSLTMPCCGMRAIPKTSKLGNYFFAHHRKGACTSATEGPEHIFLKSLIAKSADANGYEVSTEKSGETPDGEQWVADVFCKKGNVSLAIEVQWSHQTKEEFFRRQKKYAESGVRAAWIFKLRSNKEYLRDELPYEHKTPVFGIKYRPDSKQLYVPQFGVSIEAFVDGMLSGKLNWSPQKDEKLIAKIIPYYQQCWKCSQETGNILGIEICNRYGIALGFAGFYDEDIAELVAENVDRELLRHTNIGCIKERYSNGAGMKYLSNGCVHCNALMGRAYFPTLVDLNKHLYESPGPVQEFEYKDADKLYLRSPEWYFDGESSEYFF